MRYLKITLLISIGLIFQACPVEDDGDTFLGMLTIKNNTAFPIEYVCHKVSDKEINSVDIQYHFLQKITGNSELSRGCSYYERQFEGNYNKKIWILIYKQSTLDAHSWEEIQTENLYDKRYSFTLEELKAMNWTIVYDGE